MRQLAINS